MMVIKSINFNDITNNGALSDDNNSINPRDPLIVRVSDGYIANSNTYINLIDSFIKKNKIEMGQIWKRDTKQNSIDTQSLLEAIFKKLEKDVQILKSFKTRKKEESVCSLSSNKIVVKIELKYDINKIKELWKELGANSVQENDRFITIDKELCVLLEQLNVRSNRIIKNKTLCNDDVLPPLYDDLIEAHISNSPAKSIVIDSKIPPISTIPPTSPKTLTILTPEIPPTSPKTSTIPLASPKTSTILTPEIPPTSPKTSTIPLESPKTLTILTPEIPPTSPKTSTIPLASPKTLTISAPEMSSISPSRLVILTTERLTPAIPATALASVMPEELLILSESNRRNVRVDQIKIEIYINQNNELKEVKNEMKKNENKNFFLVLGLILSWAAFMAACMLLVSFSFSLFLVIPSIIFFFIISMVFLDKINDYRRKIYNLDIVKRCMLKENITRRLAEERSLPYLLPSEFWMFDRRRRPVSPY